MGGIFKVIVMALAKAYSIQAAISAFEA